MVGYNKYIIVVCLIVFTALTAGFTLLIINIAKLRLKIIKGGLADSEISKVEQQGDKAKQNHAARLIIDKVLSVFFCILMLSVFGLSIGNNISSSKKVGETPIVKVVKSGSMATIYEKNEYIVKNNLTNQIKRYDLITIFQLPSENDLKLYDIVMYEIDGVFIIHRIVNIEEANDKHSERYFLLQGDANQYPDRFPVRYSQMLGIYKNNRIPFLGSFIDFMQSPAGYLCLLLTIFSCVVSPMVDKKLTKAMEERKLVISTQKKYLFFRSSFSKKAVADYIEQNYQDKIYVKRGKKLSRSSLLIPDTYYAMLDGKNKCFAYIYATKTGDAILRVVLDENSKLKFEGMKETFFPKSYIEKWYVIKLCDKSETTAQTIIDILELSFNKILNKEVKENKQYENV